MQQSPQPQRHHDLLSHHIAALDHRSTTAHQKLPAQFARSYEWQIARLAKDDLAPLVNLIFPGPTAAIYILTRPERRHAWNAYLAAGPLDPATSPDPEIVSVVRDILLLCSSRDLLAAAYSRVPRGLEAALRRLPQHALSKEGYRRLGRLFIEAEKHGIEMGRLGELDDVRLEILELLPVKLRSPRLVQAIAAVSTASRVSHAFEALTGAGIDADLLARRLETAQTWKQRAEVIRKAYETFVPTDFPFESDDRCTLLRTPEEMRQTARRFDNCLVSLIPEFIRGESVYAVWQSEENPLVIEIARDQPFGWHLSQIRGPKNSTPTPEQEAIIESYFATKGIRKREPFEHLVGRLRSVPDPRRQHRDPGRDPAAEADPTDNLDDELDRLLLQ